MTARFKVLLVVAVLFFALNVGGAGVALLGGELAHAGVHAALALLSAYVLGRLAARRIESY
jgi:hypothetical protein